MIEEVFQYTCDGCGETDFNPYQQTERELRAYLLEHGWKRYGHLDYCPLCVANGKAKRKDTSMGLHP